MEDVTVGVLGGCECGMRKGCEVFGETVSEVGMRSLERVCVV